MEFPFLIIESRVHLNLKPVNVTHEGCHFVLPVVRMGWTGKAADLFQTVCYLLFVQLNMWIKISLVRVIMHCLIFLEQAEVFIVSLTDCLSFHRFLISLP